MSENEYGQVLEDGTLLFVRMLPGPIERVWAYLTESDKRAKWLAAGETGRQPGDTVEFHFNNEQLTPHDETVPEKYRESGGEVSFTGEVIAVNPPHFLHYSWPERDGGLTEVEFRLSQQGDRVKLELRHKRILHPDDLIGACAGWHVHLDILRDRLSGTTPGPFWSSHTRFETEYGDRLADHVAAMRSSQGR